MPGPIYNPFTGLVDEAAMRGGGVTNPAPVSMNLSYDGKVGNNTVQIYGGAPMTDSQALAHLQALGSNRSAMANGSMPIEQWQALNPGASDEDLKAYKILNRDYNLKTKGNGGVGESLGRSHDFAMDRMGNVAEALVKDPTNVFSLMNTHQQVRDYEREHGFGSAGPANNLHTAAIGSAAVIGGGMLLGGPGGLGTGVGGGGGGLTTMTAAEQAAITAGLDGIGSAGLGAGVGAGVGAGAGAGGLAAGLTSAAELAALPTLEVAGTLGSAGLTAGEMAAIQALGGAGLGAAVNSSVGTPNTGGSSGGSGGAEPSSTNPFTEYLSNNWQDLAQQGAGLLLGGAGGAATPGAGGGGSTGGAGYGGPIPTFQGDPMVFPRSGFRDDNAYNYLLQTLGLPNPATSPIQGTGVAAPPVIDSLDQFGAMDFSSMFAPLVSSSPKSDPRTAVASGTRGPDPTASGIVNAFAGAFGNGGAAFGTPKTIPTKPRRVK